MTDQTGAVCSILLVEDDSLSLKLMRDVLESSGYEVVQATNGRDGLAMARRDQPDLIVMDIGLPGMDGVEATRSLKQDATLGRIPILAVSAYAMHQDETRMRDAGCDGFMSKPLRFADFVEEVRRLLDRAQVC